MNESSEYNPILNADHTLYSHKQTNICLEGSHKIEIFYFVLPITCKQNLYYCSPDISVRVNMGEPVQSQMVTNDSFTLL
jgi:hypothetical protein